MSACEYKEGCNLRSRLKEDVSIRMCESYERELGETGIMGENITVYCPEYENRKDREEKIKNSPPEINEYWM